MTSSTSIISGYGAPELNEERPSVADGALVRTPPPMYGEFYGLSEPPFDLTPNPRFLFLSVRQKEALRNLEYGLATSRGFTLLIGDAGTGKTTLVRTALGQLGGTRNRYVLISNPTLGRAEFYEHLVRGFAMSNRALESKSTFLAELQQNVEARFAVGGLTGLIVDEAQSLPYDLLEEIRLLGNIDTATAKLLNIVLSGQPELAARLNEPSLRQLKQRVSLRCQLEPLSANETASYIAGRVRIAGGKPEEIFTAGAVDVIHRASKGIARTINVLSDNALIGGFAGGIKPIPRDLVVEVCRDFDVAIEAPPEPAAAAPPEPEQAPQREISEAPESAEPTKSKRHWFSFF